MSRLQAIWSHRYIPYVGDFLPAPRPAPVAQDTAPGVARPVLGWFKPQARVLRRMAQPLYPAVDTSAGSRASLIVVGSITGGGESLSLRTVGVPLISLPLATDEVDIIFDAEFGPHLGDDEAILPLGVVPTVQFISDAGAISDATALFVGALSVVDTVIWLSVGIGQSQPGTYLVSLAVPTNKKATRDYGFPPIRCRASLASILAS